jgi:acetyl esterase
MTTLHPALKLLAEATVASGAPRIDQLSLQDARASGLVWAEQLGGKGPAVERVEDLGISVRHGTITGRLYVPAGPLKAFIVYLHGGGWVLGNVEIYDSVARMVAVEGGSAVLLVEYRLAPEAPFPAGVEDSVDAVGWASAHCKALLGRQLPLVVMGDSAGGNLAAVVAQQARNAGSAHIAAQILIYPNTDADPTTPSFREFWEGPLFAGRSMEWFWSRYVPDPKTRLVPEVSPLRAADLAGLTPAIVVTAEFDPLRDEGEAYAAAMRAAGVRVVSYRLDGLSHGFFGMLGVFDEPARVMRRVTGELELLLADGSAATRVSNSQK